MQLEDSYIWGNVTIQEGCTITGCVIANDVTIKPNCTIGSNCLISRGITIGPDISIPTGTRLIKQIGAIQDELSGDNTPTNLDHSLVQELINLGNNLKHSIHYTYCIRTCLLPSYNTQSSSY